MIAPSPFKGSLPLALLAGGLATRLRPMTARVPKSMLPVAGEPFITHQLRLLHRQGVEEVVICCGYLGEQIQDFVGDGSAFGCRVQYSFDGNALLGTGGAIRRALPLLGGQFWVMYGDSYLKIPFEPVLDAFLRSGRAALMTVLKNGDRWDKSNVYFAGGEIVRYGKGHGDRRMNYIDYGLSLFSTEVFRTWPDATAFNLSEVQALLVEQGSMAAYQVDQRFYEMGSPSGLDETDAYIRATVSDAVRREAEA
jgi:NDP-sugar pyrophosphorylase family protein